MCVNFNYALRHLDHWRPQIISHCLNFHNSRKITTQPPSIPFPDTWFAKTFRDRYHCDNEGIGAVDKALAYPKIITRYWQVAKAMQQKQLIPFVHGQSTIWSVPQRILKALEYKGCQLLRSPHLDGFESSSDIYHRIDLIRKKREARNEAHPILSRFLFDYPLDHSPEFRNSLLAVTIGFFHLEMHESPISYVFGSVHGFSSAYFHLEGNRNALHQKDCIKIANRMISQTLEGKNWKPTIIKELLDRVEPLYQEAARTYIGQFIICGVPYDELSKSVYHCQPLGLPTGNSIEQVLKEVSEGSNHVGYQARLLLSRETLSTESRIEVVNIMDGLEVESFCKNINQNPLILEEEDGLKEVLVCKHSSAEEKKIADIENLYARIDGVINSFL